MMAAEGDFGRSNLNRKAERIGVARKAGVSHVVEAISDTGCLPGAAAPTALSRLDWSRTSPLVPWARGETVATESLNLSALRRAGPHHARPTHEVRRQVLCCSHRPQVGNTGRSDS